MDRHLVWALSILCALALCSYADAQNCVLPTVPNANKTVLSPFVTAPVPIESIYPEQAKRVGRTCDNSGRCIDAYSILAKPIEVDFGFKDANGLPLLTDMLAYDGKIPGPTIRVMRGVQTLIRFTNHINCNLTTMTPMTNVTGPFAYNHEGISTHVHGSASLAPFDGWAEDFIAACQYKDYVYPNNGEAPLWYHDHAVDITRPNTYYGLAGAYTVHPCWNVSDDLTNPEYLFLEQKSFTQVGNKMQLSYRPPGDNYLMVNGRIWPVVKVKPQMHLWTLLDASVDFTWNLTFVYENGTYATDRVLVVGADEGPRRKSAPLVNNMLKIGQGERWVITFDLVGVPNGTVIYLGSAAAGNSPFATAAPGCFQNLFMKMIVVSDAEKHARIHPDPILKEKGFYPFDNLATEGVMALYHDMEQHCKMINRTGFYDKNFDIWRSADPNFPWRFNYSDTSNRTAELGWWNAKRFTPSSYVANAWEVWQFNATNTGFHPIHIHPAKFLVCRRVGGNDPGVKPYEWMAPKDIVDLFGPNQVVNILIWFVPIQGQYMAHCHNTDHEDKNMMFAYNASDPRFPLLRNMPTKGVVKHIFPNTNPYTPNNTLTDPLLTPTSLLKSKGTEVNKLQYAMSLPAGDYKTVDGTMGDKGPMPGMPPPITEELLRRVLEKNYYPDFYPDGRKNLNQDGRGLWIVRCEVCEGCPQQHTPGYKPRLDGIFQQPSLRGLGSRHKAARRAARH